jgi:CBS domain-containing protein
MRAFEVMTKQVQTVPLFMAAADAAERMQRKRIRHLVVKDGNHVVGVVSDRDVLGKTDVVLRQQTVADIMARDVVSIEPQDTVRAAANLMRGHRIDCLPVLDRGKLVGIVTTTDLLDLLGRGVDRATPAVRASKHYRVPHRKQRRATAAW